MGAIFGVLIFMTSFLLIIRIMQYMSPGRVGILMLSEVLVAVLSAMFLGEALAAFNGLECLSSCRRGSSW